jgi:signal peptidase II
MPKAERFGRLSWLWLTLLVFVIDQATKFYFDNSLNMYNTGAAFSFLADAGGWQRWFFAVIALVVSVVLVVWLKRLKPHETWLAVALALVLGGALGNLVDRVIFGHVVDFILVHWQNKWYFPAFNFADTAITCGAILLALDMFKSDKSGDKTHD